MRVFYLLNELTKGTGRGRHLGRKKEVVRDVAWMRPSIYIASKFLRPDDTLLPLNSTPMTEDGIGWLTRWPIIGKSVGCTWKKT